MSGLYLKIRKLFCSYLSLYEFCVATNKAYGKCQNYWTGEFGTFSFTYSVPEKAQRHFLITLFLFLYVLTYFFFFSINFKFGIQDAIFKLNLFDGFRVLQFSMI